MDKNELAKILDNLNEEKLDEVAAELFQKMEKEGKTLKEASGVSDEMEEEIYAIAHGYYDQGKYLEAATLFQVLAKLNPNEFKYIYGLASAHHQHKDFINASLGFYTAHALEPMNPMPTFYLADCFLNLEGYSDALHFLKITIELCKLKPEHKELGEKCELIKKTLTDKHSSN